LQATPARPKRVLVVEDEMLLALDYARALEDWGFVPLGPAATADEAVATFEREGADAVTMDLRLAEGSNGIDAARRIAAIAPVPIVFVTGNADGDSLVAMREVEPAAILRKPLDEASLRQVLDQALHDESSA
jgi:two-component system, response regulator PdtaR